MNFIPLYDKIVVKMMSKQEVVSSAGLSYVKDISLSSNTTIVGEVVAVGEGRLLSDGDIVPMTVKIGDKIVFSKLQGESYNDGKDDYTILSEANVLMILQEENNENN